MLDEHLEILHAIAQRRHVHLRCGDPKVEIFAEVLALDLDREVPVRGRDETHVDRNGALRAEPANLAFLEDAQELRLEVARQLAELVEEDGAAVGLLEHAGARSDCAGERAALVPEELALGERRRDGAAIEHDERAVRARARLVHRLGDELLAGSRLALDEQRYVRRARCVRGPRRARASTASARAGLRSDPSRPVRGSTVSASGVTVSTVCPSWRLAAP